MLGPGRVVLMRWLGGRGRGCPRRLLRLGCHCVVRGGVLGPLTTVPVAEEGGGVRVLVPAWLHVRARFRPERVRARICRRKGPRAGAGGRRTLSRVTQQLGTVYLPQTGTNVGRFQFIVDGGEEAGRLVEVGSLVCAETDEGVVVGTVVEMKTVGSDGDPVRIVPSRKTGAQIGVMDEAMVAEVSVVASERLRSVRAGNVRAARADEVRRATGSARMDWKIPAGVVQLVEGGYVEVDLDGEFLLGPEAQGMLVGGRSGVASKTSFTSVLLRSAIAKGDDQNHRTAAVIFNVKGEDLVWIDQPPAAGYELTDDDRAMYAAMGLDPTPFEDVRVFAPAATGFGGVASPRADAEPISWDLPMAWRYLRFFFPNMYEDEKLSSFVAQFEDLMLKHPNPAQRIDTFEKLRAWFEGEIDAAEAAGASECWNGRIHIATMRRMRRMFDGLRGRGHGLFCGGTAPQGADIPDRNWRNGQVVVVDLAGVPAEVQGFVIARTVDRLMAAAQDGELGVDHLAIVTDELNAFAPAQGGEMATVRKTLQKVATQGRYAGLALMGCAQQLSKVDELLRDNCASRSLGSSAEAELTSGVHGRLSGGFLERIATLPKGQMALWHTAYRQALVVKFPRPAWRMGKSRTTGGARPTTKGILRDHLGAKTVERLVEGVPAEVADEIISTSGSVEEATSRLQQSRQQDMTKTVVHTPRRFDPDNPFDME